jgi:phosphoglycerate dehydrogenase-like enzyme
LTLHLALTDKTHHIVNRRLLGLLPERATLINTARADLVDSAALLEAAERRGLRVGLDVYPDEPRATGGFSGSDMHPAYCRSHRSGPAGYRFGDRARGAFVLARSQGP